MATTKFSTHKIKSPGEQHRIARGLGVDPEELDDYFEFGEYFHLVLEVDEDLNIVGGEFKPINS